MKVELISVGTEILLGNIVNTNAAYLAEQVAKAGLTCYYQTVVGDNHDRLAETIKTALGRADVVIMTGGLGPTDDDLTKETAAEVMGMKLVEHEESKQALIDFFKVRNLELSENNWKQALVPEGGRALPNPNGTAPGIIMEKEGKHVILLPGPPIELKPMFEKYVFPYLNALEPGVILSQTVKICNIGESKAEMMVKDLIDEQTNPTIATYAKTGEVHIRVTAKADDEASAKRLLKPMVKELKKRFGTNIYSTDEECTLEKAVADLLCAKELTLATVESCTGGMLGARLVSVPGVSEVYKAGYITYSNKAKRRLVDVKKATLDKYGAVSEQVAKEMVKGAANLTKADVTVSITGIAGPDGGTVEKPVGLVYIACDVCGKVTVRKNQFKGGRQKIRESATSAALSLMRQCILEYYSEVTFGEKK